MILLENLMSRPDFGNALDNLIPEFREQFSLPEIHQLGLGGRWMLFSRWLPGLKNGRASGVFRFNPE